MPNDSMIERGSSKTLLLFYFKVVVETEKELMEFMHGERNAIRGDLVISRERTDTSEYYYVSSPENDEFRPILKGWAKKIRVPKTEPMATIEEVSVAEAAVKSSRHSTGGKRPYVMVMQDKEAIVNKLSINAFGMLMKLVCFGYVEWGTGKVINRRTKKSLTAKMICEKLGLKIAEGKPLLAELTDSKALRYDRSQKAYFIDRTLAKKGGDQSED